MVFGTTCRRGNIDCTGVIACDVLESSQRTVCERCQATDVLVENQALCIETCTDTKQEGSASCCYNICCSLTFQLLLDRIPVVSRPNAVSSFSQRSCRETSASKQCELLYAAAKSQLLQDSCHTVYCRYCITFKCSSHNPPDLSTAEPIKAAARFCHGSYKGLPELSQIQKDSQHPCACDCLYLQLLLLAIRGVSRL
jgi:hypothetical protein